MNKNLSVIILAGGNSTRTKLPKIFFPFNSRLTFIEKIVKEYVKFGCSEIILVLNKKFYNNPVIVKLKTNNNIKLTINEYHELGRFYSLSLGIAEIKDRSFIFIQNADNPFIDFSILDKMYSKRNNEAYVIPIYKEKAGHPVLIGKTIIKRLRSEKNLESNLRNILHEYKRIGIPVKNEKVLANINSMSDYKKYFKTSLL